MSTFVIKPESESSFEIRTLGSSKGSIPLFTFPPFVVNATLSCKDGVNHITKDPECLYELKRYDRKNKNSVVANFATTAADRKVYQQG